MGNGEGIVEKGPKNRKYMRRGEPKPVKIVKNRGRTWEMVKRTAGKNRLEKSWEQ